jgi:hypothetical protein
MTLSFAVSVLPDAFGPVQLRFSLGVVGVL